jgi:hypothetical protein
MCDAASMSQGMWHHLSLLSISEDIAAWFAQQTGQGHAMTINTFSSVRVLAATQATGVALSALPNCNIRDSRPAQPATRLLASAGFVTGHVSTTGAARVLLLESIEQPAHHLLPADLPQAAHMAHRVRTWQPAPSRFKREAEVGRRS